MDAFSDTRSDAISLLAGFYKTSSNIPQSTSQIHIDFRCGRNLGFGIAAKFLESEALLLAVMVMVVGVAMAAGVVMAPAVVPAVVVVVTAAQLGLGPALHYPWLVLAWLLPGLHCLNRCWCWHDIPSCRWV